MKFCKRCGSSVEAEDVFCGECGAVLTQSQDVHQASPLPYSLDNKPFSPTAPEAEEKAAPEPERPIFDLAEGERILRSYHCCEFGHQRIDGTLTITTQRILFSGGTDEDICLKELPLVSYSGMDLFWGTDISWGKACGGLALIFCGLAALFTGLPTSASVLLLFAGAISGAVLLYLSLCRKFMLTLYSIHGQKVTIGTFPETPTLACAGEDAEKMARELGALLHDLQSQGEDAASKWENATL